MRQVDRDLGLDAAGPRAHDDDAAAEEDRLLDVVGDEQHGLLLALPDAEQQLLHQRAGLVVERAERLVEQQDLGIVGERARDRGALLHAAGELLGTVVLEAAQADPVDATRRRSRRAAASARRARAGRSAMFSRDGQPREQRVGLEHHAAIGARAASTSLAVEQRRGRWSAGRGRRRCAAASTCRSPTGRGW